MLYTISFQSTLPVWGATFVVRARHPTICDFNPRSPCGERPPPYAVCTFLPLFQSTLPVWGATHGTCYPVRHITNFNPRSPCGERLDMTKIARNIVYFNPRSPCGERRPRYDNSSSFVGFQSTLPVWGATIPTRLVGYRYIFQSTLPVWGATLFNLLTIVKLKHFNPRSPCGERLCSRMRCLAGCEFQSTLPVWGATTIKVASFDYLSISIHAPRVGSDYYLVPI